MLLGGGAAHLRTLVVRERGTVMGQEMEESMMETEDAGLGWCVGVTTARSLVLTTMRRMTAVRGWSQHKVPQHQHKGMTGESGLSGAAVPGVG
jgi:hypothetical protein